MLKKKSLGQHFLQPGVHTRAVAEALSIATGELVVEIGPGEGALTGELLKQGARVMALEKDARLLPILTDRFREAVRTQQLILIEGDALLFDTTTLPHPWKLVGNIPYYITGALLRAFLTTNNQPSCLVFLMQKEVAQRIARSKKESLLSLSVKAFGTPEYIKTVPRGAFSPPPGVDSAILRITDISRARFANRTQEDRYFALLHAGFGQKRKLLRRNLESVLGEKTSECMEHAGIPLSARAEDVPVEQWIAMSKFSL